MLTFVSAILLFASCDYSQKSAGTKDIEQEHNDAKFDNNKKENDAQFLVNAAEIDLEQIQLGQLAQQKGITSEVKELGKMMEDTHTKLLNDLTALAKGKMISMPNSSTDNALNAYKTLNAKTGDDFDKAYADMMVNKHKDAIDAFVKASTESYNSDIKNWAKITLTDLRSHLNYSIDCQIRTDNM
jgi:putative membrane protein